MTLDGWLALYFIWGQLELLEMLGSPFMGLFGEAYENGIKKTGLTDSPGLRFLIGALFWISHTFFWGPQFAWGVARGLVAVFRMRK